MAARRFSTSFRQNPEAAVSMSAPPHITCWEPTNGSTSSASSTPSIVSTATTRGYSPATSSTRAGTPQGIEASPITIFVGSSLGCRPSAPRGTGRAGILFLMFDHQTGSARPQSRREPCAHPPAKLREHLDTQDHHHPSRQPRRHRIRAQRNAQHCRDKVIALSAKFPGNWDLTWWCSVASLWRFRRHDFLYFLRERLPALCRPNRRAPRGQGHEADSLPPNHHRRLCHTPWHLSRTVDYRNGRLPRN